MTYRFKVASVIFMNFDTDRNLLLKWYQKNKRQLPWRQSKNPYSIWISEVMLQQTTVTAVVPFFTKFIARFPTVKDLAEATIEEVYEYWAGLGYYSRARNIHKAAQILVETGFPKKYEQLIELPGFGPYTSRAVSSIAFNEKTGVLDGNVIRILTRKYGLSVKWWETKSRNELQTIADQLAQTDDVADLNQAMMELGATVCTPKKVMCLMCPWQKDCISLKKNLIEKLPLKKEKPDFESWLWTFEVFTKKVKDETYILLEQNNQTPFLKNNWLPPSKAKRLIENPKKFVFKHGVTKFDIYVSFKKTSARPKSNKNHLWHPVSEIKKINPTSLMTKIIKQTHKK